MARNVVILDLETRHSAEDCRHCGTPQTHHQPLSSVCIVKSGPDNAPLSQFEKIGWDNHAALGLSIGGYFDYASQRMVWFDEDMLEETVRHFVETKPLIVGFNSIQFDLSLILALLENQAEHLSDYERLQLMDLCASFRHLFSTSYDILAEIWQADPERKFERGLNSLDALARANGLGGKIGHGAQAPRDWQAGRIARVVNYCQDDVLKTVQLFEMINETHGWLKRGDGSWIGIRYYDHLTETLLPPGTKPDDG